MDITYIIVTGFTSNKGGVENIIMQYYRAIKALNSQIVFDIITYDENPAYKDEILEKGGIIKTVPSPRHINSKHEINSFFKENAGKYDAIWCNKCDLGNIDYIKYAARYGIPKRIIHSHSISNMYTGIKGLITGFMHKKNQAIIKKYATDYWACSDYAAKWMFPDDILDNAKVQFIPNAIETSKYKYNDKERILKRHELNLDCRFVVGMIGRLTYVKNVEFALEVFNCLKAKIDNAEFLIAGSGELENEIKRKADNLSCRESVHFLGFREDVPELMQALDVLLLPSRFEGLPVVAIEAQAAGLPVFAASDGISKQTKVTELVHFLRLCQGAEYWAEEIYKCYKEDVSFMSRGIYAHQVEKNGFEIMEASKRILSLLIADKSYELDN